MAVTMKNAVLVFLCSVHRWLITADVVPSSLILVTQMMEVLSSSEMSILTRTTLHNIQEDGIPQMEFLKNFEKKLRIFIGLEFSQIAVSEHKKTRRLVIFRRSNSQRRKIYHAITKAFIYLSSVYLQFNEW
jgi:hypothetical protein